MNTKTKSTIKELANNINRLIGLANRSKDKRHTEITPRFG